MAGKLVMANPWSSSGNTFEFATAAKIRFGNGVMADVGVEAARWGLRALITTGLGSQDAGRLSGLLEKQGISSIVFRSGGEPSVPVVDEAVQTARKEGCDLVIGFGGGSAIDTGKAVAALLTNPGEALDYLEVVGHGKSLVSPTAPFIAVPTTAGTGSEVTRNAVLYVPQKQVKVSLRSPMMLARAALIDPELTYSLPAEVTASTGMDALSQLIEPYVSRRANPVSDLFCRDGIPRVVNSLRRAYHNGQDTEARADMALASCFSGLALANAGLGAVHGLAGPVGGSSNAPHGAVCAALLPPVVKVNARILSLESPHHPALQRYREIAKLVAGDMAVLPGKEIEMLIEWLDALRLELNIPGLREYGISTADLDDLAGKGVSASSTKANPVTLSKDQLREILVLAL